MMDSLCRQTERLNESRSEVESLKTMLYREKDDTGQYESIAEREEKLVDMLKSAQEERETLMLKLEQMNAELQETRAAIVEKDERTRQLTERVKTLECALDAKHAEHKQLDQEIAQAKDQCSGKQIEINRLTDLLDNAKTKVRIIAPLLVVPFHQIFFINPMTVSFIENQSIQSFHFYLNLPVPNTLQMGVLIVEYITTCFKF